MYIYICENYTKQLPHLKTAKIDILVPVGIIIQLMMFWRVSEARKTFHREFPKVYKSSLRERLVGGVNHLRTVDKRVFYMLAFTFITGIVVGNMDAFTALFADELGFSHVAIGLLIGIINTSFLFAIPLYSISKKIGKFGSMILGQFIMGATILSMGLYSNSIWWLPFVMMFMHWGAFMLVKPVRNGIIAAFTPKHLQGEMRGIQKTTLHVANFVGGIAFGYISKLFGIEWVFTLTAIVYFIMMAWLIFLGMHYEKSVRKIALHPHASYLQMLHTWHLGHSIPNHHNAYMKKKGTKR